MSSRTGIRHYLAKNLVETGVVSSELKGRNAVDVVFSEVARLAIEGKVVEIRGLGIFYRKDLRARTRVHPRTGEKVVVPASWKIVFRAGKYLRGRIER